MSVLMVVWLLRLIPIIPELVLIIPFVPGLQPGISNIIAIDNMAHPNLIILEDINAIGVLIARDPGPTEYLLINRQFLFEMIVLFYQFVDEFLFGIQLRC
jgi:hypothetical protein